MKKVISVILALAMLATCAVVAFAAAPEKLTFDAEGNFKILLLNDTQDVGKNGKEAMTNFVKAALEKEQPDLVIFNGDQLSDLYPGATVADYKIAIQNVCGICEALEIPFAVTMGNHDHDRMSILPEEDMWKELYSGFTYCVNGKAGGEFGANFGKTDYFTCNIPVYANDGEKMLFNVYVMDSNNNDGTNGNKSGYDGVNPDQIEWYKAKSDELKAANGGEIVPSMSFQHVPVKEIYNLLKKDEWNAENAIYSRRDGYWYTLDETKVAEGGTLGEAPCSEDFDTITGQYQAWLEKGDMTLGAWFAHDHVNNFYGVTDDGITLGYNGGASFRSYGIGLNRSVRVFEFKADDVEAYTTRTLTYQNLVDEGKLETASTFFSDLLTPAWLNRLMLVVYALFGWAIDLFK